MKDFVYTILGGIIALFICAFAFKVNEVYLRKATNSYEHAEQIKHNTELIDELAQRVFRLESEGN